tara:strand:+ start:148 stop:423 length:276 start_codon:yes stop_codon:yes gene_type:complete
MSNEIVIPTVESFVVRVLDTITNYSKIIECTPERGGWDPMFKKKTPGKWQVKNERNAIIREISEEASFFGYDLSQHLANMKCMTQDVVEGG